MDMSLASKRLGDSGWFQIGNEAVDPVKGFAS